MSILGALEEAQQKKIRGLALNGMKDKEIGERLSLSASIIKEARIEMGISKREASFPFVDHEEKIRKLLARGYNLQDIVEDIGLPRTSAKAQNLTNYLKKNYGSKEEFVVAFDRRIEKEHHKIVSKDISKKIVAEEEARKLIVMQLELAKLQFGEEAMEKIELAAMAMIEIYNE